MKKIVIFASILAIGLISCQKDVKDEGSINGPTVSGNSVWADHALYGPYNDTWVNSNSPKALYLGDGIFDRLTQLSSYAYWGSQGWSAKGFPRAIYYQGYIGGRTTPLNNSVPYRFFNSKQVVVCNWDDLMGYSSSTGLSPKNWIRADAYKYLDTTMLYFPEQKKVIVGCYRTPLIGAQLTQVQMDEVNTMLKDYCDSAALAGELIAFCPIPSGHFVSGDFDFTSAPYGQWLTAGGYAKLKLLIDPYVTGGNYHAISHLPRAVAGCEPTIVKSAGYRSIQLYGSRSYDSEGSITFNWAKVSGSGFHVFSSPSAANPTINGIFNTVGTYVIRIRVTDLAGNIVNKNISFNVVP